MIKKWVSRLALVVVFAIVAAAPVAFAQSRASSPVAVGGMDVQVWPEAEPGQTVVIATVTLEDDTELPATVRIPVIAGMEIQWVGEISGPDPSQDPTRTYTVEQGTGGEYVEFEVSTYRLGQVEMLGLPIETERDASSVTVPWVQSAPATITAFSVRMVPGVRDVDIEPAPAAPGESNPSGESLFTLPSKEMEPGDELDIAVSYESGTQFEGGLDGGGNTRIIIGILAGAIVVAVLFLAWAIRRQQASG